MYKKGRIITILVVVCMAVALLIPQALWAAGPKNVLYYIGDGTSTVQRRAPEEIFGRAMIMNTLPVLGLYTTYSTDSAITDSAAAGTALACGMRTKNGVISMDPMGRVAYESIATAAKRMGKSVGLVTTSRITHATPACFGSNIILRAYENEIAEQLVVTGFEVIMGGGLRHFVPQSVKGSKRKDDRDLTKEAAAIGYDIALTTDEMMDVKIGKDTKILGLFWGSHVPYYLDMPPEVPSLADMTEVAINILKQNPNGFFLMIEAARIDHACHANDPAGTIGDTEDLDNAVKVGMTFMMDDADTLIFVGGDHECGGMALGIGKDYFLVPEVVLNCTKTFEWLSKEFSKNPDNAVALISEYAGITDFTDKEIKAIEAAAAKVKAKEKSPNTGSNPNWLGYVFSDIISKRSRIGWTSFSHTAHPVMVTAAGVGSETFGGWYDITDTANKVAALWGITLRSWPVK